MATPHSSQNSRGGRYQIFRLRGRKKAHYKEPQGSAHPPDASRSLAGGQRKGRHSKTTPPRKRLENPCTPLHAPRTRASRRRNRTSVRTLTIREGRSHDVSAGAASLSQQVR